MPRKLSPESEDLDRELVQLAVTFLKKLRPASSLKQNVLLSCSMKCSRFDLRTDPYEKRLEAIFYCSELVPTQSDWKTEAQLC